MNKESRDYLEMSFRSVRLFAADGGFSAAGLQEIIDIARRDGVIDQNEIRVLKEIISRLKPEEINAEMRAKLAGLSELLNQKLQ